MTARSSKSGYHTVTPFLLCHRVAEVIEFLSTAFDAHEIARIVGDRGEVLHAEVQLGDSKILMGEPDPKIKRLKATAAHHYVFVSDIQASYQRALIAGGTSFSKPVGLASVPCVIRAGTSGGSDARSLSRPLCSRDGTRRS